MPTLPLEEQYFRWLYSQVGLVKNRNLRTSYFELLRLLHTKEFTWGHPRDENRAQDGKDLRLHFLEETDANAAPGWLEEPCDMLELLITLARKLEFQDLEGGSCKDWFWHLLQNIGVNEYNDAVWGPGCEEYIHDVLDRVIQREYSPRGEGGLFPLDSPLVQDDQREIELWYQLSAYLLERA